MNILALDTSDQVLSSALLTETGFWHNEADAGSRHSELLMEAVDQLFAISHFSPSELDLVACMKGPGSFTGLRIGFSAAKGIALALDIPLISVPTLDCLAFHASIWPGLVIPSIDAKKACFFTALYHNGDCLTEHLDASPEAIAALISKHSEIEAVNPEKILLTGPGAVLLKSALTGHINSEFLIIDPESKKGRARELIELTKSSKIYNGNDINSGPVYLRKSDAELNWV